MPAYRPLRVVLADKLQVTPPPMTHDRLGREIVGPCLVWTAAKDRAGYGVIGNKDFGDKRIRRVHRVMYALFNGGVTEGLDLDHLCRVRSCASPAHLEEVEHAENIRRGDGGIHQRSQTHCKHGHEFSESNTMRGSRDSRMCRTCHNAGQRRRWLTSRKYLERQAARR